MPRIYLKRQGRAGSDDCDWMREERAGKGGCSPARGRAAPVREGPPSPHPLLLPGRCRRQPHRATAATGCERSMRGRAAAVRRGCRWCGEGRLQSGRAHRLHSRCCSPAAAAGSRIASSSSTSDRDSVRAIHLKKKWSRAPPCLPPRREPLRQPD